MWRYTLLLLVCFGIQPLRINAQAKVILATKQKVFGGRGGVFMNYTVSLKHKKSDSLSVDSVIILSDRSTQGVSYNITKPDQLEFVFSRTLGHPPKCHVCPDPGPIQPDVGKGIRIYYHSGGKTRKLKVKKFAELADLKTP